MRRIAAIVLPSYRIEIVRARSRELEHAPLAIVVADKSERELTGGVRIDDASEEARVYGVRPGATIASAKARCHDLRVRVVRPADIASTLEGLAEVLLSLGAITSPRNDRDAVLVDVTGCAHLHELGERGLLARLISTVKMAGFACHASIASGPEIAWAIAASGHSRVVAEADTLAVLGELPIDVLRLDERTTSYLERLGLHTLAELRSLPRKSLASRVGEARATRVLALMDGRDATPLERFVPKEILEEHCTLDYGAEHLSALSFVFRPLCDRVAARLQGRCMRAARVEIVLDLDRSFVPKGESRTRVVSLPLASPLGDSSELQSVLRSRFEREPPLSAPVLGVAMRVPELVPRVSHALHLFVPESRADLALPKLAAELSALLGEGSVGVLAVKDDWRFFERSHLVPIQTKPLPGKLTHSAVEPLRLHDGHVGSWTEIAHIARYEWLAWWREAPVPTDMKLAWSGEAMVFIEVEARGAHVRGVLD